MCVPINVIGDTLYLFVFVIFKVIKNWFVLYNVSTIKEPAFCKKTLTCLMEVGTHLLNKDVLGPILSEF